MIYERSVYIFVHIKFNKLLIYKYTNFNIQLTINFIPTYTKLLSNKYKTNYSVNKKIKIISTNTYNKILQKINLIFQYNFKKNIMLPSFFIYYYVLNTYKLNLINHKFYYNLIIYSHLFINIITTPHNLIYNTYQKILKKTYFNKTLYKNMSAIRLIFIKNYLYNKKYNIYFIYYYKFLLLSKSNFFFKTIKRVNDTLIRLDLNNEKLFTDFIDAENLTTFKPEYLQNYVISNITYNISNYSIKYNKYLSIWLNSLIYSNWVKQLVYKWYIKIYITFKKYINNNKKKSIKIHKYMKNQIISEIFNYKIIRYIIKNYKFIRKYVTYFCSRKHNYLKLSLINIKKLNMKYIFKNYYNISKTLISVMRSYSYKNKESLVIKNNFWHNTYELYKRNISLNTYALKLYLLQKKKTNN